MAVEQIGEIYMCSICGNEVRVIKAGGGILVCCGQDMEQMEEQLQVTVDIPDMGG